MIGEHNASRPLLMLAFHCPCYVCEECVGSAASRELFLRDVAPKHRQGKAHTLHFAFAFTHFSLKLAILLKQLLPRQCLRVSHTFKS